MIEKDILFVDENDVPIGSGTREEARAKAISYRLSRIILKDESGKVLSQHRSQNKKNYPGLWTDSASGHVDVGEDYEIAAYRELFEEMGVKTQLTFLGTFSTRHEDEGNNWTVFNGVFEGEVPSSTPLRLQESEVQGASWYELDVLKREMKVTPEKFTPGFLETIRRFYSE